MGSVFDQVGDSLAKSGAGLVEGARGLSTSLFGSKVTGTASELLSGNLGGVVSGAEKLANDVIGTVAGTSVSGIVSDVGGQVLGSIQSQGGVAGQVAGIVGGLLGFNSASQSWGKLNSKLIAQFYACDSSGLLVPEETGLVLGPITDASIEYAYNWQSPFENTGPESKAPALMAMLQTGQFATVINALQTVLPDSVNAASGGLLDEAATKAKQVAKSLEGRTGITRLNSRQVFSGMPPIKINLTLHLRAVTDPESEINAQYQRLLRWSLPQQLAKDGALASIIKSTNSSASTLQQLFPSIAPLMVAFNYGGQSVRPMVIESISNPLDTPRYRDGNAVYLPVQITLATLTALDRNDVLGMFL